MRKREPGSDGRLFEIARKLHSLELPDDDAFDDEIKIGNSRFDAYLKLLEDNGTEGSTLNDGSGADLITLFEEQKRVLPEEQVLPATATIKLRPAGDHHADKAWTVTGTPYKIQLEKHAQSEWVEAQVLFVYLDLDDMALFNHQYEVVADVAGGHPDTPGVELQAYLDRLSRDDLVEMIAYLRDPYVPANAYYINQAQLAIWRETPRDQDWLTEQGHQASTAVLNRDTPLFLNVYEEGDNEKASHPFVFNAWWYSARLYDQLKTPFQADLFAEESLAERFSIKPQDLCSQPEIEFVIDSPSTDKHRVNPTGPGLDKYSKTDKREVEVDKDVLEAAPVERITCPEFKAVIAKAKDLEGQTPQEVRDLLAKKTTVGGTSFLDVMDDLAKKYKKLKTYAGLAGFKLPTLITSEKDLAKWAIKKIIKKSAIRGLVVALEVVEFLELSILLPAELYNSFLEDQQAAVDHWVYIGKLTAVRQYLRELHYQASKDAVSDPISIDLSTPSAVDPEALERYHLEAGPTAVVVFLEDLKKGYAEQKAKLGDLQDLLLDTVKQLTTDLFGELDLSPCKAQALIDAGFIDLKQTRARALEAMSQALLDELPKVQ